MGEIAGITISISADALEACVAITAACDRASLSVEGIATLLGQKGVQIGPEQHAAIESLISDARSQPVLNLTRIISRGTPAVHGTPGRIEFMPGQDPSAHQAAPTVADRQDRVDYHARSTLAVARRGQPIGRIIPPGEAVHGADVTGRVLSAHEGTAFEVATDDSVELRSDGTLIAAKNGLIELRGKKLRVLDTLELRGFVDFSTGNIDFPGDVSIGGGVRDCFSVRCDRDLSIREMVEAADITAARDCTLERGMAGRFKGSLNVGRDLKAHYLDAVRATVGRDAAIDREIATCELVVVGRLTAPSAAIVGGSAWAACGIEIAQLGGDSEVATEIVVGRVAAHEELLRRALSLVPETDRPRDKVRDELNQIRYAIVRPTPSQAREISDLTAQLTQRQAACDALAREIRTSLDTIARHTNPVLRLSRVMLPGVRLWIGHCLVQPRTPLKGPLEITLNELGQPLVRFGNGPTSLLSTIARVIPDGRFLDLHALRRRFAETVAAAAA